MPSDMFHGFGCLRNGKLETFRLVVAACSSLKMGNPQWVVSCSGSAKSSRDPLCAGRGVCQQPAVSGQSPPMHRTFAQLQHLANSRTLTGRIHLHRATCLIFPLVAQMVCYTSRSFPNPPHLQLRAFRAASCVYSPARQQIKLPSFSLNGDCPRNSILFR